MFPIRGGHGGHEHLDKVSLNSETEMALVVGQASSLSATVKDSKKLPIGKRPSSAAALRRVDALRLQF